MGVAGLDVRGLGEGMKPRISYQDFLSTQIDFDSLEYEKSELLLDGELVIYAGSHYDSLVWLKRKNEILCFRQQDVRGRLKMNTNAKGI
jgi:hypothetical protein